MQEITKFKQNEKMTDRAYMTTKNVAMRIMSIMEIHIGKANMISKDDLFKKIYEKTNVGDLGDFVRWVFVKRAMSYLRKNSHCFIVLEKIGSEYFYFVVKKSGEERFYTQMLDKSIAKMYQAKARVKVAINEKWYKTMWLINEKNTKKIIK